MEGHLDAKLHLQQRQSSIGEKYMVTGLLTFDNAQKICMAGCRQIKSGQAQFDFSKVEKTDSSGLAVLFAWLRLANSLNMTLIFLHLPASLQKMAAIYGVTEILSMS